MLRQLPAAHLAVYYTGSLPFVLGLLYFWADMSRNAYAQNHCSTAAFGLAILFIWMKTWQAEFCSRIHAVLIHSEFPPLCSRRLLKKAYMQSVVQASGLIVLPLAFIIAIPFAWCYAFYQNFSALDNEKSDLRQSVHAAWDQAKWQPLRNHMMLFILFTFGIFVFLNIASAIFILPYLIKMLFGTESVFTLSGRAFLNSTFAIVTLGVSYLCADPLIKTVYSLRCYYSLSLRTGEDIIAELKTLRGANR